MNKEYNKEELETTNDDILLEELKDFTIKNVEHYKEKLESTKKHQEKTKEWYELNYSYEFYNNLYKKFFSKDFVTESIQRLNKIKNHIKDLNFRYELVLKECDYKINTEDQIEAYEKNYICESLLSDFFAKNNSSDEENIEKETTESKISSLLDDIDNYEKEESDRIENENKKEEEFSKLSQKTLSDRIDYLYNELVNFAKEKDQEDDGIILSYIESIFNPKTSNIDEKNLYLNLKFLNTLKKFDIIDWDFDTSMEKIQSDEYDLSMKHWQEIMSENLEEDDKFFKIIEKNLTYGLYSNIISELANKADRSSITEKSLRTHNLLVDEEDGERELTMSEYLLDNVEKMTTENTIIIVTPDMIEHMDIHQKNTNNNIGDEHLKYIGKWKSRWIYSIEPNNFKMTKGLKNFVFIIKNGNKYLFNPEKPILYYHILENPFLEKPIIKLFTNCSLNFYMANTTLLNVKMSD